MSYTETSVYGDAFKSQRRTGNTEIYVPDVSSTAGLR
jgi:hypothetical protein